MTFFEVFSGLKLNTSAMAAASDIFVLIIRANILAKLSKPF